MKKVIREMHFLRSLQRDAQFPSEYYKIPALMWLLANSIRISCKGRRHIFILCTLVNEIYSLHHVIITMSWSRRKMQVRFYTRGREISLRCCLRQREISLSVQSLISVICSAVIQSPSALSLPSECIRFLSGIFTATCTEMHFMQMVRAH
jgi:hypothetical protein